MKKLFTLLALSLVSFSALASTSLVRIKLNNDTKVCTVAALNNQIVYSCNNIETQKVDLPNVDYTRTASAGIAEFVTAGFKVASCANQMQLLEVNITCVLIR